MVGNGEDMELCSAASDADVEIPFYSSSAELFRSLRSLERREAEQGPDEVAPDNDDDYPLLTAGQVRIRDPGFGLAKLGRQFRQSSSLDCLCVQPPGTGHRSPPLAET